jgi:hypothetical protein
MDSASTQELPRAFLPEFARTYDGPGTTPGWDLDGPERRMEPGRTLARATALLAVGAVAGVLAVRQLRSQRPDGEREEQ